MWAICDTLIALVNVPIAESAGIVDDVSVELSWALSQTLVLSLKPTSFAGDADIQTQAV